MARQVIGGNKLAAFGIKEPLGAPWCLAVEELVAVMGRRSFACMHEGGGVPLVLVRSRGLLLVVPIFFQWYAALTSFQVFLLCVHFSSLLRRRPPAVCQST